MSKELLEKLTKDELLELEKILKAAVPDSHAAINSYRPYLKQTIFHAAGAFFPERLLMAGNQLGKTLAGANEVAMHLTGIYPDWWVGKRFDRPIRAWVAGESSLVVRDTTQKMLFGDITEDDSKLGTGIIPTEFIMPDFSRSRGISDAIDTATVKHVSGGMSMVKFKSYEQAREKWQGDTIDLLWCDEEPPEAIFNEGVARTTATKGIILLTFTPLKGASTVVNRWLKADEDDMKFRHVTKMTMYDAEHLSAEDRERLLSQYPEHERDTRLMGIPMQGSGRVFPYADSLIAVKPFEIPTHWPKIVGLDIGIDHPTAAVWLAWDKDADIIYLTSEYRRTGANIPTNAAALMARGDAPIAWPHDAHKRDPGTGLQIRNQYKDAGCNMLSERATWPDGGNSVEAGISELATRMETGRFKVFDTCLLWFEEFRAFHRKDGLLVAKDEDLISATRYAYMMRRYARTDAETLRRKMRHMDGGGVNDSGLVDGANLNLMDMV